MKKIIYPRFIVLTFWALMNSVWAWGEEISFNISKGNVIFTNATYAGFADNGSQVTGDHNPENKYIVTGTTTEHNIQVGAENEKITQNFIIYLNNVDIKKSSGCAFSVYNQGLSVVAVILQNGSKNKLYSGENRAGLEKSGGAECNGTLLITCEAGYEAWKTDNTHGHTTGEHNKSACTETCGSLDARSGNAWDGSPAETYNAGAGIGTAGRGSEGSNKENVMAGTNALVNLTIAGGNIEARGAWGYAGGTSGGAAAIGTGCASGSDITAGTITGFSITGGNIKAYRIDDSAACIGGGYRSGYVTMDIYGGTIDATLKDELPDNKNSSRAFNKMRAAAIGGGGGGDSSASPAGATITIHNGDIKAEGQYGAAIGSGSGGKTGYGQYAKVTIHNGNIVANTNKGLGEGSGAAIGSGGSTGTGHAGNADIIINGGIIVASSELGADIGGGGTNSTDTNGYGGTGNVTISGGTITVTKGGIGGGRANAGVGGNSTITISGENTEITAESIGGGRSAQNTGGDVNLTVKGGTLTVADFIGGGIGGTDGTSIGRAEVKIEGGVISGRTVMKASTRGGCKFEMTGGTLTSPIEEPGGAVYMIDPNGVATMSGGTIQDCQGTDGGAVYMTGGTFTISDGTIQNCQGTDGGAVYLAGTGKVFVNGGIIQNNKVTANGGAIYMAGGEFTMTNGTIDGCNGTNSGTIYMSDGTFTISGGTISGSTGAANGGAVYLAGTEGEVLVSGGTIQSNTVTGNGGAIYMSDGTFTMTNGTINSCKGTTGGAVYMNGGKFTISEDAIMTGNSATDGGAVYLAGTGELHVNGGTIQNNTVSGSGGAIYLNAGTFTMTEGEVKANSSTGGDGAGIYIANGTVTVGGGEVSGNIATKNGGGFYVGGGTVNLTNGLIASNKAELAGGGIYFSGNNDKNDANSITITGCTLTKNEALNGGGIFSKAGWIKFSNGTLSENKANAGNGGGIYATAGWVDLSKGTLTKNEALNGGGIFLSDEATMMYQGGLLTYNKATGTGDFKTAWHSIINGNQIIGASGIQGVGGGIYISDGSNLTLSSTLDYGLGIYANSATMAADDLFADGDGTTLVVPNIANMSLQDYAGNAEGLGWYEDYFVLDTSYSKDDVAKGDYNSFEYRFKEAQKKGNEYLREYKFVAETITFKNTYVAFALGFLYSDLIIKVKGLQPGESCIFSVTGTAEGKKYKYQVPIHGSNAEFDQQAIIKLPIDQYTVTLLGVWPWAYEIVGPVLRDPDVPALGTIIRSNSENEGIYEFEVRHNTTSIVHDEDYVKKQF